MPGAPHAQIRDHNPAATFSEIICVVGLTSWLLQTPHDLQEQKPSGFAARVRLAGNPDRKFDGLHFH
jgi:hypothetical protein